MLKALRIWHQRNKTAVQSIVYVVAVMSAATMMRMALNPVLKSNAGLVGFPFAVMICAWFAGFYAGLLATLVGLIFATIFYISPSYSLEALHLREIIYLISAIIQGIAISFISRSVDASRKAAEIAARQAEQANQAKSQFLANMSHEIRTPLGVMLGFVELTQECLQDLHDTPVDEARMHLNSIQRNGKQLMHLIDELLDLAKVEADRIELENTRFSPKELFAEVQEMFAPRAARKNLRFQTLHKSELPPFATGDAFRIKQIIINLLSNAIKFTEAGSIEVETTFIANSPTRGMLSVRVKDSGIGLAPDQRQKLFQPFSQAENSTTRKFGGTGLGLALSLRLAHLLGGDLTLEKSGPQEGSVFALQLPLAIEPATADGLKSPLPRNADGDLSRSALQAMSVLLVEDSRDNQEVIGRFVRGAGARVDFANDGLEAVKLVRQKNYDVILMDIQMPNMNGYEATGEIRRLGIKTPIIALTAYALAEERARSLAAGCNEHMTKPIERQTLIARLAEFKIGGVPSVNSGHSPTSTPIDRSISQNP